MNQAIGILAGMGPRSTSYFLDLVIEQCSEIYGAKYDIDFPLMDIISLPTPFYLDREINHKLMISQLNTGIAMLENNGCQLIAIPCNIAHVYFNEIEHQPKTRILNIVDETIKMINPNINRVTLLATVPTIVSNIYQSKLEEKNIAIFYNDNLQKKVTSLINEFKLNKESEYALNILNDIDKLLKKEEITTIIVACTDLAFISKYLNDYNVIDSSKILAYRFIKEYLKLKLK